MFVCITPFRSGKCANARVHLPLEESARAIHFRGKLVALEIDEDKADVNSVAVFVLELLTVVLLLASIFVLVGKRSLVKAVLLDGNEVVIALWLFWIS